MKYIAILSSFIIFLISYFLPAYYEEYGYKCAKYCLVIFSLGDNFLVSLYYFPFNFTNAVMFILPAFYLTGYYNKIISLKLHSLLKIIFALLFLHVISWWFVNFFSSEIRHLHIGYYLWAFSIGLFTFTMQKVKR